MKGRQYT